MGVAQSELTVARQAAEALLRAVEALGARYPDSVDVRRLTADAHRIVEDLDLLGGPAQQPGTEQETVVVPDHDYPPEFWQDADHD